MIKSFKYDTEEEATEAISDVVDKLNDEVCERIKEDLSKKARGILNRNSIDPDCIWSVRFSIDDFIFLSTVSPVKVARLVEKIKTDPAGVKHILAKCLESGIMYSWDVVAETAVDEVLDKKEEETCTAQ